MKIGEKPRIRFERDGERYIVMLGDDRAGFVCRYAPHARGHEGHWAATDTFMRKSKNFRTLRAAGEWLRRETERAIAAGEL